MSAVRYGPTTGQATADADGSAVVTFLGPAQWETIDVDTIALAVVGSDTLPEARLYGAARPTAHRLLATDLNGSSGSFDRTGDSDRIEAGEAWCVEWVGATPGATCTATASGTLRRR